MTTCSKRSLNHLTMGLAVAGLSFCLALPALAQDSQSNDDAGSEQNATAMSTSTTDDMPTADAKTKAEAKAKSKKASIKVSSQAVAGNELLILSVDLPESGWVVIHYRNKNGQISGDPIGSLHLSKGHYENITINLNAPVEPGETLVAMLHTDGPGANESYGETADHEVMKKPSGKPVMVRFKITQPADEQKQPVAAGSGHIGNTEDSQSMK